MASTFTPNLNLEKIGYDEQDETWGDTENANWDKVDTAYAVVADAAADAVTAAGDAAPSGLLGYFARSTAPTGWIKARAGYIGNAGSGSDVRANADCLNLFTLWWTEFPTLQLQTSGGVNVARGANAAADFAALKRMPVFDERDKFSRGWKDDLAGGLSGNLMEFIQDAMQRITGAIGNVIKFNTDVDNATGVFTMGAQNAAQPGTDNGVFRMKVANFNSALSTSPNAAKTNDIETRVKNSAKLACWKL